MDLGRWGIGLIVEVLRDGVEKEQLFGLTVVINTNVFGQEPRWVDLFADGFLFVTPDDDVPRRYIDIVEVPADGDIRIGALCRALDASQLQLTVEIDRSDYVRFDLSPLEPGTMEVSELRELNSELIPRHGAESFPPRGNSDRSLIETPQLSASDRGRHAIFRGTDVAAMLSPLDKEVSGEGAHEATVFLEEPSDGDGDTMFHVSESAEMAPRRREFPEADAHEATVSFDEPSDHTVVTLLFGTNREPGGPSYFSHERGRLSFGLLKVSVPGDRKLGDLKVPAWWQPWRRPDPAKHFYVDDIGPVSVDELGDVIRSLTDQGATRAHALVFVHGYNTDFEEAGLRAAQLYKDLEFPGLGAFFSWPSQGKILRYGYDENSVRASIPSFREFLERLANEGIEQFSFIAHSMGNRLVAETLTEARLAIPVNQVLLAAPDIDAQVFREQIAPRLVRPTGRYTVYASDNDKALRVSSFIAGYRRLGDTRDGVVVVAGLDSLDVSELDATELGHGYIFDRTLLADVHSVLTAGVPPQQRFGLRQTTNSEGNYWSFRE